jgi:hypothetical protein
MLKTIHYAPPAALTALEAAILAYLTAHYQLPALTAQVQHCRVSQREYSGAGFFTALTMADPAIALLSDVLSPLEGCQIEAPGLSDGAGSLLFVREGRLHLLEVHTWGKGDIVPEATEFGLRPSLVK